MLVLSLYDSTLTALRPWAAEGHRCVAVDVLHPSGWSQFRRTGIQLWGGDIRAFPGCDSVPDIVMAWPPCTHLALSGARWWKPKGPEALAEAMELVEAGRKWCRQAKIGGFIENPVGRLATHWRKPDSYWDPFEYAGYPGGENDRYRKRTCMWLFGRVVMPDPRPLPICELTRNRIHRASGWDKKKQKAMRSATPRGFAQAFFEANKHW